VIATHHVLVLVIALALQGERGEEAVLLRGRGGLARGESFTN
jgi:hypothetical protein